MSKVNVVRVYEVAIPTLTDKAWPVPMGGTVVGFLASGKLGCYDILVQFAVEVADVKEPT